VRFLLREWQAGRAGLKTVGRRASNLNGTDSLCQGGVFPNEGFNGFCAGESVGVLCRTCSTRYYFDSTKQRCTECPSAAQVIESNWAPIVTAVVLLMILYTLYHYVKRPSPKTFLCIHATLSMLSHQLRRLVLTCRIGSFMAQLKLFVTFSQLTMEIPNVYNTRVPPLYFDVALPFKAFDLEWHIPVNSACISTSAAQLLAYGLTPIVLSAMLLMVVMTFR
jgi:hypothetical protein